jgi:hypothetical protein
MRQLDFHAAVVSRQSSRTHAFGVGDQGFCSAFKSDSDHHAPSCSFWPAGYNALSAGWSPKRNIAASPRNFSQDNQYLLTSGFHHLMTESSDGAMFFRAAAVVLSARLVVVKSLWSI